ncbi:class I adenylate-forming enzyme family protein [Paenibacillus tarimensis]|uniref:class I adenylate-forming enzyme family protein n=1 Tax=Paenibacillus tarimensis TaxID=416012 RepID=UPI001F36BA08|nr:class I adenylate-forming enzyme family protein [Paenibacillus tarimensis]MCF2945161.1 acyl--CoA ligase [Paenibacillus tarimensis]
MQNVAFWLSESGRAWGDREALVTEEQTLTYRQLEVASNRFASQCTAWGIQNGERIAIYISNSSEAVVSILGSLKQGAVFTCIHPETPHVKAAEMIADAQASLVISSANFLYGLKVPSVRLMLHTDKPLREEGAYMPNGCNAILMSFHSWLSAGDPSDPVQPPPRELAALIYTSGSTGKPKGVMSSHANIRFTTEAINRYLKHTPEDRVLSYLPLSFDYGLYQLFLTLSRGACLHLRNANRFMVMDVHKQLSNVQITGFPGLRTLFSNVTGFNGEKYSHIRYLTNTGDYLPEKVIQRLVERFPNAALFLMYGVTECKRVSYLLFNSRDSHKNSIGIPLNNTEAIILDEGGNECPSGKAGELTVWGDHVCMGYWRDEARTAEVFIQQGNRRGIRTGDLFCKDADGFLYYLGRKDNMFKSKGFRIDPFEIENVLSSRIDDIADIVVTGIPDRHAGYKIGAFVVLKEDSDELVFRKRVRSVAEETLEPWKQPDRYVIGKGVPLTHSGKIDRKEAARQMGGIEG